MYGLSLQPVSEAGTAEGSRRGRCGWEEGLVLCLQNIPYEIEKHPYQVTGDLKDRMVKGAKDLQSPLGAIHVSLFNLGDSKVPVGLPGA